ncbi:MAG TPA: NFACT family protein, partial [Blastocatellia bacterium]|nr:NFACT family protein [Blastocatellia bacterium]
MDNFLLHAIVTELESVLIEPPGHRRVGRIYQFGATDLMIDLRLRDERWLAISTDPQRLALYLTSRSPRQTGEEARSDTAFVALAKKHLTSARLAGLEKLGYDRIVKFEFTAEAEDSPPRPLTLIVRLTGRGANVLLVEGSQILAALRELDETVTSYADPPPPPEKLDPFLCPPEKLDELIARSGHDLAEAATKYLIGFSPIYARELAVRAARQAPEPALRGLLAEIFDSPPSPALYGSRSIDELRRRPGDDDFSAGISPIELVHLADQRQARFPTVNQAAEAYFTLIGERRRFLALKQRLQTHLSSRLKKQRALLANLQREREGFANASTQQRYGELLLANLHQALKSDAGFLVTDYYDSAQTTIEIPSANKATPQEAAE